MPLRQRLSTQPETVQDFDLAAEQKYWEGIELLATGNRGAGIYLMGYTAEMLLKNACFRLETVRPTAPVASLLGPARNWMKARLPTIACESYHSVWFWTHLLRQKRRFQGRAMPAPLDWELVRRVRRIYQIWWVEMRYRPDQAYANEAQAVYDDVTWLRDHYVALWR